jgi:hypothetical protein
MVYSIVIGDKESNTFKEFNASNVPKYYPAVEDPENYAGVYDENYWYHYYNSLATDEYIISSGSATLSGNGALRIELIPS